MLIEHEEEDFSSLPERIEIGLIISLSMFVCPDEHLLPRQVAVSKSPGGIGPRAGQVTLMDQSSMVTAFPSGEGSLGDSADSD